MVPCAEAAPGSPATAASATPLSKKALILSSLTREIVGYPTISRVREDKMRAFLLSGVALAAVAGLPGAASAQGTIKIGVISAYSGQFADTAAQIDNGIKLYMKQHGDTVAGKKIAVRS